MKASDLLNASLDIDVDQDCDDCDVGPDDYVLEPRYHTVPVPLFAICRKPSLGNNASYVTPGAPDEEDYIAQYVRPLVDRWSCPDCHRCTEMPAAIIETTEGPRRRLYVPEPEVTYHAPRCPRVL